MTSPTKTLPQQVFDYSAPQPSLSEIIPKSAEIVRGTSKSPEGRGLMSILKKTSIVGAQGIGSAQKRPREEDMSIATRSVKPRLEELPIPIPIIPQTPQKVRPAARHAPLPVQTPFQLFSTQAHGGTIIIQKKPVSVRKLATGSYMDIFVPVSDDKMVIKIYNALQCQKKASFLEGCLASSLSNYNLACDFKVPVATIYNYDTALQDRFLLQEYIPYEVDINNASYMNQIYAIFITSLREKLPLDLLPSNLRVKEDGTVVLVDFIEESDDDMDNLEGFISDAVTKWTCLYAEQHMHNKEMTKAFLENLTKGFEEFGFSSTWKNDILDAAMREKK